MYVCTCSSVFFNSVFDGGGDENGFGCELELYMGKPERFADSSGKVWLLNIQSQTIMPCMERQAGSGVAIVWPGTISS